MITRNASLLGDTRAVECVRDYRRSVRRVDFTHQTVRVEATVCPLTGFGRCQCDFLRILKRLLSFLQMFVGFTVGKKTFLFDLLNFLCTFAYSRKAPATFVVSVRTYQHGFQWTEFYEIWYWRLTEICRENQIFFSQWGGVGGWISGNLHEDPDSFSLFPTTSIHLKSVSMQLSVCVCQWRFDQEYATHCCVSIVTLVTRTRHNVTYIYIASWPSSWSSGQGLWLLIMRSRLRFPASDLGWFWPEFFTLAPYFSVRNPELFC